MQVYKVVREQNGQFMSTGVTKRPAEMTFIYEIDKTTPQYPFMPFLVFKDFEVTRAFMKKYALSVVLVCETEGEIRPVDELLVVRDLLDIVQVKHFWMNFFNYTKLYVGKHFRAPRGTHAIFGSLLPKEIFRASDAF